MIPVNHSVPSVACRVESEEKSFAFSGDTTTNDGLWKALPDLKLHQLKSGDRFKL